MTKFEVLFRILLIVVILRHSSGGECKKNLEKIYNLI